MSVKIHQPHDSLARLMLSDMKVARELIKAHGSADVVKRIDWETLQLTNKSFVTEELKQFHSDVIYKCTIDNKEAYVYVLVEHQSTPEELLPLRILEYSVLLMKQHISEGNKKLPIITPVCIYAGQQSPYPYSTNIYDCFEDPKLAREIMFKPSKLLDLTVLTAEELLKDGLLGLVEILLKQGIERDHLNWINNNPVLICELTSSSFGLSAIIYILGTDNVNDSKDLIQAMIKASPNQKDIVMTAAFQLQEEGRQEGIQQEKLEIAKSLLEKDLSISFIQEVTRLSAYDIENLKKNYSKR
jgi:predicted transposase/invertase (TIGR01784 family)